MMRSVSSLQIQTEAGSLVSVIWKDLYPSSKSDKTKFDEGSAGPHSLFHICVQLDIGHDLFNKSKVW